MKFVAILLGIVVVGLTAGFVGYGIGRTANMRQRLRGLGFTPESARLFRRAAVLINGTARVTRLDGDFAGDQLSPETKQKFDKWIDDYRKARDLP